VSREHEFPTIHEGRFVTGRGGANQLGGDTWESWSAELSRKLGEDVSLHNGTLNVEFSDTGSLRSLLENRLGDPILSHPAKTDDHRRNPYHFHIVRLYHARLPEAGKTAFLWYSNKKKHRHMGKLVASKVLEFALESVQVNVGDSVRVDFSDALRAGAPRHVGEPAR
jgi:hypothetical protein